MKDLLIFHKDTTENVGKYPLSSNIKMMEWNDEDWGWPLRVTFWHGGTYEYDVANIPAFNVRGLEFLTYKEVEIDVSNIWTLLKQGARWSKEQADTGEYVRGSHGAAFDYLIKKPIGKNKALYRKVENNE